MRGQKRRSVFGGWPYHRGSEGLYRGGGSTVWLWKKVIMAMITKLRDHNLHCGFVTLGLLVLSTVSLGVAQDRLVPDRVTKRPFTIVTNASSPPLLSVPKEWQPYLPTRAPATEIQRHSVGEMVGRGVLTAPHSVANAQGWRAEDSTPYHLPLRCAKSPKLPGLYLLEPKHSYHLIDFRHHVSPGEL
jgi:hypothetical protein